jgi:hypothetical protein
VFIHWSQFWEWFVLCPFGEANQSIFTTLSMQGVYLAFSPFMSYFFINFFPQFYLSFWRYNYWHFQEKLEHTDILSFVFIYIYIYIYIINRNCIFF